MSAEQAPAPCMLVQTTAIDAWLAVMQASDAMHDQIQSSSARGKHSLAQLSNLFHVGQFVRAVITSLGSAEGPETATAAGHTLLGAFTLHSEHTLQVLCQTELCFTYAASWRLHSCCTAPAPKCW